MRERGGAARALSRDDDDERVELSVVLVFEGGTWTWDLRGVAAVPVAGLAIELRHGVVWRVGGGAAPVISKGVWRMGGGRMIRQAGRERYEKEVRKGQCPRGKTAVPVHQASSSVACPAGLDSTL